MKYLAAAAALVGATYAHGHHDDQTPIEGPHQGLWYNQLPGDGGTQVRLARLVSTWALLTAAGGFCFLGDFDFRASSVCSLPSH